MNPRNDSRLARALSDWVAFVDRHARRVFAVILAVTAVLAVHAALVLEINSDNVRLMPPDLPSRRAHDRLVEHFPNLEEAIFVVLDARTPELAREASERLAEALARETDVITDVDLPGAGEFFERNGLLFRSVDELDLFADQMARIQPLISELEREPTIAHMARIVREGLDAVGPEDADADDWQRVLERLGEATVRAWDAYPVPVSWEEVLLRGSAIDVSTRRAIILEPVLEYDHVLQARKPIARIRELAERLGYTPERGVTVRITGNPALNYDEMIGLAWDVGGGSVFTFLVVALVLLRALRSTRMVLATLITLLVGLIWTASFTAAVIGSLNPFTITFAILFIGLGVDYAIHLCSGYADLRRAGREHAQAARETAARVGSSLAFCTLTTVIGFYVFVPTEHIGVSELGTIAGTGMIILFVLTLTLLPALLGHGLQIDPERDLRAPVRFERGRFARLDAHPAAVRRTALLAGLGALALLPGMRFDCNVVEMRDPDTESVQALRDLLADPIASPWYLNALTDDLDSAVSLAERLEALPEVGQAVTLASFVPADQAEKAAILADVAFLYDVPPGGEAPGDAPSRDEQIAALRDLRGYLAAREHEVAGSQLAASMLALRRQLDGFLARIEAGGDADEALADLEHVLLDPLPGLLARLRRALEPEPFGLDDLPPDVIARMMTPDGTARVQIFPSTALRTADELDDFVLAVRAAVPEPAGMAVNLYEFGQVASRSFTQALASALLIISGLLYALWRDWRSVARAMAPLVLGATLTAATAVLLDIRFNFTNVVVIPLLFGIGVDSSIHLVQRARDGFAGGGGLLETATARAVYYSAVTTIVSFGSLALAGHNGVESLGLMLTIGLVYMVLCVLVVLPALLDGGAGPTAEPIREVPAAPGPVRSA